MAKRKHIVYQDSGLYSTENRFNPALQKRVIYLNRFQKREDGTFYGNSLDTKVELTFHYTAELGYYGPRVNASLSHVPGYNKNILRIMTKVTKALEALGYYATPEQTVHILKATEVTQNDLDNYVWHPVEG